MSTVWTVQLCVCGPFEKHIPLASMLVLWKEIKMKFYFKSEQRISWQENSDKMGTLSPQLKFPAYESFLIGLLKNGFNKHAYVGEQLNSIEFTGIWHNKSCNVGTSSKI